MAQQRRNAIHLLMRHYEQLMHNPNNSGIHASISCRNFFKWHVVIDGPPGTPYEGGKFSALLTFPDSFPQQPPTLKFVTDILHPNINTNGEVCISILHPPGTDPFGNELATERWQRTRTVESILVSVQLLMAEPNFDSPANVDAAILSRNDPERYLAEVRRRVEIATATTEEVTATPPSEEESASDESE